MPIKVCVIGQPNLRRVRAATVDAITKNTEEVQT